MSLTLFIQEIKIIVRQTEEAKVLIMEIRYHKIQEVDIIPKQCLITQINSASAKLSIFTLPGYTILQNKRNKIMTMKMRKSNTNPEIKQMI